MVGGWRGKPLKRFRVVSRIRTGARGTAHQYSASEPVRETKAARATGETELVWPLQQYRFLYIIIIVIASDWSETASKFSSSTAAAAATTTAAAAAACACIALVLSTGPASLVTYYYYY